MNYQMENKKIVLLGGKDLSTRIVFNELHKNFGVVLAIIEEREDIKLFISRRIRRMGLWKVIGQIGFQLLIGKPLGYLSKKRLGILIKDNDLDTTEIPADKMLQVSSVNAAGTIEALQRIDPDLIIVNGTRIISKKLIGSVRAQLINTHAGITPEYRGVHGMYWALANNDAANSGVTIHFVDEGIDTGNIIYQEKVLPGSDDNFATYPMLQLAAGIKLLNKAVEAYFANAITTQQRKGDGALWYHPTLWQYVYKRIFKGIK